jgi:hypothetical protein
MRWTLATRFRVLCARQQVGIRSGSSRGSVYFIETPASLNAFQEPNHIRVLGTPPILKTVVCGESKGSHLPAVCLRLDKKD